MAADGTANTARAEDANRVFTHLGKRPEGFTALELSEALFISVRRVQMAVRYIRQTSRFTDGIPVRTMHGDSYYYRTAELDWAYVRGIANQTQHLATRLDTAYREAQRAQAMQSRQPDALRKLFGMGMNHLRTARESIGYYGEALRDITAHLGGEK